MKGSATILFIARLQQIHLIPFDTTVIAVVDALCELEFSHVLFVILNNYSTINYAVLCVVTVVKNCAKWS